MEDKAYSHNGKLYEILGQYGVCTVIEDIATQNVFCVTRAYTKNTQIHWQLSYQCVNKTQGIQFAKEVNMTHEQIKNRALIERVTHVIDDEINAHKWDDYNYDFDAALDSMTKEYSTFDICTAVALSINLSEWDGRYSNTSKDWARNFLYDNDIDTEIFKNARLCNTHRTKLNGFAEWLSDKAKSMNIGEMLQVNNNDELDLTQEQSRGR